MISLCVTIVFTITSTTYGVPGNVFETKNTDRVTLRDLNDLAFIDPQKFLIPENFGTVTERFRSAGTPNCKKLIIQIQDSHCNYEAQMNICKIIETMTKDKETGEALKMIAVEGYQGLEDPTFERAFPDKKIREDTSDYFLKIGWITGPEFYAINCKDKPLPLWGIESKNLYDENLGCFEDSKKGLGKENNFIDKLSGVIEVLQRKVFSEELAKLINNRKDWDNNTLKFTEYCMYLNDLAVSVSPDKKNEIISSHKYPNFCSVMETLKLEKGIDNKKIDSERKELVNELQKVMVKEELSDLVKQSLLLRVGKITSPMFYKYLEEQSKSKNVDMNKYPNLSGYIKVVLLHSKMNPKDMFDEIEEIETDIKEKLYRNAQEKELNGAIKDVKTLKNLLNLRMTRRDLAYFDEHKKVLNPDSLINKVTVVADQEDMRSELSEALIWLEINKDIDLKPCEEFYDYALERDEVLVENTINEMEKKKATAVAVVSGGFHTEGMKELFKAKGYSYVIVTPRMTRQYDDKLYLARMLNEQSEFDKLFGNTGNRLAAWSLLNSVRMKESFAFKAILNALIDGNENIRELKLMWMSKLGESGRAIISDMDAEYDAKTRQGILKLTLADGRTSERRFSLDESGDMEYVPQAVGTAEIGESAGLTAVASPEVHGRILNAVNGQIAAMNVAGINLLDGMSADEVNEFIASIYKDAMDQIRGRPVFNNGSVIGSVADLVDEQTAIFLEREIRFRLLREALEKKYGKDLILEVEIGGAIGGEAYVLDVNQAMSSDHDVQLVFNESIDLLETGEFLQGLVQQANAKGMGPVSFFLYHPSAYENRVPDAFLDETRMGVFSEYGTLLEQFYVSAINKVHHYGPGGKELMDRTLKKVLNANEEDAYGYALLQLLAFEHSVMANPEAADRSTHRMAKYLLRTALAVMAFDTVGSDNNVMTGILDLIKNKGKLYSEAIYEVAKKHYAENPEKLRLIEIAYKVKSGISTEAPTLQEISDFIHEEVKQLSRREEVIGMEDPETLELSDKLRPMFAGKEQVSIARGGQFIKSGTEADKVYMVLSGEAVVTDKNGMKHKVKAGSILGEIGAYTKGKRTADVTAGTNLRLAVIDADEFRSRLDNNLSAKSKIETIVERRKLSNEIDQIEALVTARLTNSEASDLMDSLSRVRAKPGAQEYSERLDNIKKRIQTAKVGEAGKEAELKLSRVFYEMLVRSGDIDSATEKEILTKLDWESRTEEEKYRVVVSAIDHALDRIAAGDEQGREIIEKMRDLYLDEKASVMVSCARRMLDGEDLLVEPEDKDTKRRFQAKARVININKAANGLTERLKAVPGISEGELASLSGKLEDVREKLKAEAENYPEDIVMYLINGLLQVCTKKEETAIKHARLRHKFDKSLFAGEGVIFEELGNCYYIEDFIGEYGEDMRGGFSLGFSKGKIRFECAYQALSTVLGVADWNMAYLEQDVVMTQNEFHEKDAKTDEFMTRITQENKPIVFFVPYDRGGSKYTFDEMQWLMENKDKMKNVYFVFGAYEADEYNTGAELSDALDRLSTASKTTVSGILSMMRMNLKKGGAVGRNTAAYINRTVDTLGKSFELTDEEKKLLKAILTGERPMSAGYILAGKLNEISRDNRCPFFLRDDLIHGMRDSAEADLRAARISLNDNNRRIIDNVLAEIIRKTPDELEGIYAVTKDPELKEYLSKRMAAVKLDDQINSILETDAADLRKRSLQELLTAADASSLMQEDLDRIKSRIAKQIKYIDEELAASVAEAERGDELERDLGRHDDMERLAELAEAAEQEKRSDIGSTQAVAETSGEADVEVDRSIAAVQVVQAILNDAKSSIRGIKPRTAATVLVMLFVMANPATAMAGTISGFVPQIASTAWTAIASQVGLAMSGDIVSIAIVAFFGYAGLNVASYVVEIGFRVVLAPIIFSISPSFTKKVAAGDVFGELMIKRSNVLLRQDYNAGNVGNLLNDLKFSLKEIENYRNEMLQGELKNLHSDIRKKKINACDRLIDQMSAGIKIIENEYPSVGVPSRAAASTPVAVGAVKAPGTVSAVRLSEAASITAKEIADLYETAQGITVENIRPHAFGTEIQITVNGRVVTLMAAERLEDTNDFANGIARNVDILNPDAGKYLDKIYVKPSILKKIIEDFKDVKSMERNDRAVRAVEFLARHEYLENVLGDKHANVSAVDRMIAGSSVHPLMEYILSEEGMTNDQLTGIKPMHEAEESVRLASQQLGIPMPGSLEFYEAALNELADRMNAGNVTPEQIKVIVDRLSDPFGIPMGESGVSTDTIQKLSDAIANVLIQGRKINSNIEVGTVVAFVRFLNRPNIGLDSVRNRFKETFPATWERFSSPAVLQEEAKRSASIDYSLGSVAFGVAALYALGIAAVWGTAPAIAAGGAVYAILNSDSLADMFRSSSKRTSDLFRPVETSVVSGGALKDPGAVFKAFTVDQRTAILNEMLPSLDSFMERLRRLLSLGAREGKRTISLNIGGQKVDREITVRYMIYDDGDSADIVTKFIKDKKLGDVDGRNLVVKRKISRTERMMNLLRRLYGGRQTPDEVFVNYVFTKKSNKARLEGFDTNHECIECAWYLELTKEEMETVWVGKEKEMVMSYVYDDFLTDMMNENLRYLGGRQDVAQHLSHQLTWYQQIVDGEGEKGLEFAKKKFDDLAKIDETTPFDEKLEKLKKLAAIYAENRDVHAIVRDKFFPSAKDKEMIEKFEKQVREHLLLKIMMVSEKCMRMREFEPTSEHNAKEKQQMMDKKNEQRQAVASSIASVLGIASGLRSETERDMAVKKIEKGLQVMAAGLLDIRDVVKAEDMSNILGRVLIQVSGMNINPEMRSMLNDVVSSTRNDVLEITRSIDQKKVPSAELIEKYAKVVSSDEDIEKRRGISRVTSEERQKSLVRRLYDKITAENIRGLMKQHVVPKLDLSKPMVGLMMKAGAAAFSVFVAKYAVVSLAYVHQAMPSLKHAMAVVGADKTIGEALTEDQRKLIRDVLNRPGLVKGEYAEFNKGKYPNLTEDNISIEVVKDKKALDDINAELKRTSDITLNNFWYIDPEDGKINLYIFEEANIDHELTEINKYLEIYNKLFAGLDVMPGEDFTDRHLDILTTELNERIRAQYGYAGRDLSFVEIMAYIRKAAHFDGLLAEKDNFVRVLSAVSENNNPKYLQNLMDGTDEVISVIEDNPFHSDRDAAVRLAVDVKKRAARRIALLVEVSKDGGRVTSGAEGDEVSTSFGEELASGHKDKLERMLKTPQGGANHNEGPTVRDHLNLMLTYISYLFGKAANAKFENYLKIFNGEVPERIREILKENADIAKKFILYHDIAKADTLKIGVKKPAEIKKIVEAAKKLGIDLDGIEVGGFKYDMTLAEYAEQGYPEKIEYTDTKGKKKKEKITFMSLNAEQFNELFGEYGSEDVKDEQKDLQGLIKKISYPFHDQKAEELLADIQIDKDPQVDRRVKNLIKYHMAFTMTDELDPESDMVKELGEDLELLVALAYLDGAATVKIDGSIAFDKPGKFNEAYSEYAKPKAAEVVEVDKGPQIEGKDLKEIFSGREGIYIGKVLGLQAKSGIDGITDGSLRELGIPEDKIPMVIAVVLDKVRPPMVEQVMEAAEAEKAEEGVKETKVIPAVEIPAAFKEARLEAEKRMKQKLDALKEKLNASGTKDVLETMPTADAVRKILLDAIKNGDVNIVNKLILRDIGSNIPVEGGVVSESKLMQIIDMMMASPETMLDYMSKALSQLSDSDLKGYGLDQYDIDNIRKRAELEDAFFGEGFTTENAENAYKQLVVTGSAVENGKKDITDTSCWEEMSPVELATQLKIKERAVKEALKKLDEGVLPADEVYGVILAIADDDSHKKEIGDWLEKMEEETKGRLSEVLTQVTGKRIAAPGEMNLTQKVKEKLEERKWKREANLSLNVAAKYLKDYAEFIDIENLASLLLSDGKKLTMADLATIKEMGLKELADQLSQEGGIELLEIVDLGVGTIDERQDAFKTLGFQA